MTTPSFVLVQHVHLATTSHPSAGASALTAAALYVAVTSAGLLAAPVLTGAASNRRLRLALAVTLLGGALAVHREDGVFATVVVALHLVTAAIWAGGVFHLAILSLTQDGRRRLVGAIRRLAPWAVSSAAALVASGYLLLRSDRVGLGSLGDSGFGRVVLVKIALLAIAAVLGLGHRVRLQAGALAGAVGLAGVLVTTGAPAPLLQMAGPGLAVVRIPAAPPEALLVTAERRGVGVVRVLSSESLRLVDEATGQARQVGPGGVARVVLRSGVATLGLTSGLSTVRVSVRAGSPVEPPADGAVTADRDGWLDYQLGRVLGVASGGTATSTSAAGCAAPSALRQGAALGTTLRRQHATRVAVLSDRSPRAAALSRGLDRAGVQRVSLRHTHTALVATDAARARAQIARMADKPRIRAVYLAPWLLDGRVLSLLATTRLPPLLVASGVDAMSPLADHYRAALASVADGVLPSVAGLVGYADAVAPSDACAQDLTVYSASPVGFLPGVLDVGHDHGSDDSWFAGGTLVPVN